MHGDQADDEGDNGGAEKPGDGAAADAAERGDIAAHMADAGDKRSHHQRCDDHLDEAQKDVGDDGKRIGRFVCALGVKPLVEDEAGDQAGCQRDQNPQG